MALSCLSGKLDHLKFDLTMPLNIPGILVPFQLLLHPRLVIPSILVKGNFSLVLLNDFDQCSDRKIYAMLTFLH